MQNTEDISPNPGPCEQTEGQPTPATQPAATAPAADQPSLESRLAEMSDAYLRAKAEKLNIPIMNQDQFLYFVGYFERATQ